MHANSQLLPNLQLACGYEYTSKLHRMFTDMRVSEDLNNNFSQYLDKNKSDVGISFSLLVLQVRYILR